MVGFPNMPTDPTLKGYIQEVLKREREGGPVLTAYFNGLRRDCETGEWQDIDVACPGLSEPYRSNIKSIQRKELEERILLFSANGKPIAFI
jgi:hypothetical protein